MGKNRNQHQAMHLVTLIRKRNYEWEEKNGVRDKRKCIYFSNGICNCSRTNFFRCIGSSWCEKYDDKGVPVRVGYKFEYDGQEYSFRDNKIFLDGIEVSKADEDIILREFKQNKIQLIQTWIQDKNSFEGINKLLESNILLNDAIVAKDINELEKTKFSIDKDIEDNDHNIDSTNFFICECRRLNLKENKFTPKEKSFTELLFEFIDRSENTDASIYKRAGIDRRLFSKIRCDTDYSPSKKTVLAFIFALELNLDDALKLLKTSGYTLSPSSVRDLIIENCIESKIYNLIDVNNLLYDYGQEPILFT